MLVRDIFVRESNLADDLLLSGFLRPDRQLRRFLLDSSPPQAPRRRHLRPQSLRRWSVHYFPMRLKFILDGLLLVSTIPNDIMERYGHFPFPDLGCKLTSYATFIFMSCTRYSVVILALDRYIAVGCVSFSSSRFSQLIRASSALQKTKSIHRNYETAFLTLVSRAVIKNLAKKHTWAETKTPANKLRSGITFW